MEKHIKLKRITGFFKNPAYPLFFQVIIVLVALVVWFDDKLFLNLLWNIWWPLLIPLTFFLGRIWCTLCPIFFISSLTRKIFSLNRPLPDNFQDYSPIIAMLIFLFMSSVDWAVTWEMSPDLTYAVLLIFFFSAIILHSLFKGMIFCRFLCPIGAVLKMFSAASFFGLVYNPEKCQKICKTAGCCEPSLKDEGKCEMYIVPRELDSDDDCNLCAKCIKECEHASLSAKLHLPFYKLWSRPVGNDAIKIYLPLILLGGLAFYYVRSSYCWMQIYMQLKLVPGLEQVVTTDLFRYIYNMLPGIIMFIFTALLGLNIFNGNHFSQDNQGYHPAKQFAGAYVPLAFFAFLNHQLFAIVGELKRTGFMMPPSFRFLYNPDKFAYIQFVVVVVGIVLSIMVLIKIYHMLTNTLVKMANYIKRNAVTHLMVINFLGILLLIGTMLPKNFKVA